MKTQYLVRRRGFEYQDDCYTYEGLFEISGIFESFEAADAFVTQETINHCIKNKQVLLPQELARTLEQGAKVDNFEGYFNQHDEFWDSYLLKDLMKTPLDKKTKNILEVLKFQNFVIIPFNQEIKFYHLSPNWKFFGEQYEENGAVTKWAEGLFYPAIDDKINFPDRPQLFQSEEDCLRSFCINEREKYLSLFRHPAGIDDPSYESYGEIIPEGLQGSLTKISDLPYLFEAFLRTSIHFVHEKDTICVSEESYYSAESFIEEMLALMALLKQKPYMIHTLSLQEAQKHYEKPYSNIR